MIRPISALPVVAIAIAACGAPSPPAPVTVAQTPAPLAAKPVETQTITVSVGETKALPAWDVTGFRVSDDSLVRVSRRGEDGGTMHLRGIEEGTTTIDVAHGSEPRTRLVVVVGPPNPSSSSCTTIIELRANESKSLPTKDLSAYSLSDAETIAVRVTPDQKQFVISAKRPGLGDILWVRPDGTNTCITVVVKKAAT